MLPLPTGSFLVGCMDFMSISITQRILISAGNIDANKNNTCPTQGKTSKQTKNFYDHNSGKFGCFVRLFYPTIIKNKINYDELESPKLAKGNDDASSLTQEDFERPHWLPKQLYAEGFANFLKLPSWLFGKLTSWLLGGIQIHAYTDAPLIPHDSNPESHSDSEVKDPTGHLLPVVVFSHGLGGNRNCYTSFCSELASKGFIVAAVEHRDESASATYFINENGEEILIPYRRLQQDENEFELRNKQVNQRAEEISAALSLLEKMNSESESLDDTKSMIDSKFDLRSLKGRLDLNNVAVVGHSFGGATAITTMAKDKRFKCGVVFDAWMLPLHEQIYEDVDQPILFVNSETFHWKDNIKRINRLLEKNKEGLDRQMITIRGTTHQSQADIPSVFPRWILKLMKLDPGLDQQAAMDLQRRAMWVFLTQHLDIGQFTEDPILSGKEGVPEHVLIGTNVQLNKL